MPVGLPRLFTPPARWRAAALLAGAVLLLHMALLGGLPMEGKPGVAPALAPTLKIRAVATVAVAANATSANTTPTTTPAQAAARARPEPGRAPSNPSAAPLPNKEVSAEAETPAAADSNAVPTYPTLAPSAATLHFELRRGSQTGQAVLAWRPTDAGYELTLDSSAFGVQALGSASRGAFDAAGMAPDRYVDKRRGREVRATNFQRQPGVISFSGPPQVLPLLPGSQDRLSWMLQLPAILRANSSLATPGARLQMWVVGSRGEADVWVFTVVGTEDLQLPEGPVLAALHLLREPRRPYDTQVEVWLDPARQHLPVRARLGVRPTGEGTELLLQRLE